MQFEMSGMHCNRNVKKAARCKIFDVQMTDPG